MVKEQKIPNYRFQYQALLYCDRSCYRTFPVDIDFFAEDNKKAKDFARDTYKSLSEKGIMEKEKSDRLEYTEVYFNFLRALKNGKDLGRRIDVNVHS